MMNGKLVLEARVYTSADLNHSNNMVQYCLEDLIRAYTNDMREEGVKVRRVYIWSDGCSQQFKSRYQALWVALTARKRLSYTAVDGEVVVIEVHHHFFASCHGKNLSDALSGLIKSYAGREEVRGRYITNTDNLCLFMQDTIDREDVPPSEQEVDGDIERVIGDKEVYGKMRFRKIKTVMVDQGVVNHTRFYETDAVSSIQSYHALVPTKNYGDTWGEVRKKQLA